MRRRLPVFAFLTIFTLGAASTALACSCLAVPASEVYAQSDFVFVARVVGVRLVTQNPVRNSPAEYEVTFQPVRRIKGGDPGRRTARFKHTFEGMAAADIRPPSDEKPEIALSSCDIRYPLDEIYIVFLKRNEPLGTIGMCSSRVRKYSWDALQEVESLRK